MRKIFLTFSIFLFSFLVNNSPVFGAITPTPTTNPTPTSYVIPDFQTKFSTFYDYAKQMFFGSSSTNPSQIGIDYCSPDNLIQYFGNDMGLARQASCICQNESVAQPDAVANTCGRTNLPAGTSQEYSVGLFQINLNVHSDYDSSCNKYISTGSTCSVNDTGMRTCLTNTNGFSVATNATYAYNLYKASGNSWRAWSTHVKCNLN